MQSLCPRPTPLAGATGSDLHQALKMDGASSDRETGKTTDPVIQLAGHMEDEGSFWIESRLALDASLIVRSMMLIVEYDREDLCRALLTFELKSHVTPYSRGNFETEETPRPKPEGPSLPVRASHLEPTP